MLSDFEFAKDAPENESRETLKKLKEHLSLQQQEIRGAELPVIVVVDGWDAAGKGGLINQLISELDPRFASVFSAGSAANYAERYPFIFPFARSLPETGKLLFLDGGWMDSAVREYSDGGCEAEKYLQMKESVNDFERTLRDNGYVVIKLFVHIPKKVQKKRLKALLGDKNTAWRVTGKDIRQNRKYESFLSSFDGFMAETSDSFPYHILDGTDKKRLYASAFQIITDSIDAAVSLGRIDGAGAEKSFPMSDTPRLCDVDLSQTITDEDYEKQLKFYRRRLNELHNAIYRRRIPVVIGFEGWDAAGKGGTIRRLAYPLDPRGFDVYPVASPDKHEKARHYLWRFWTRLPRSGHIAIFDRTWYGRVMVERIEGFCSENAWRRAYTEINDFERLLTQNGAVVLKFWLQIDSETQLARFTLRQNTPEKQWKITAEDWRNREKWAEYEASVSEMLEKTSTQFAPWHIIESVDKRYARIKVMKTVTEALEKALSDRG